jgi:hypothetical protein
MTALSLIPERQLHPSPAFAPLQSKPPRRDPNLKTVLLILRKCQSLVGRGVEASQWGIRKGYPHRCRTRGTGGDCSFVPRSANGKSNSKAGRRDCPHTSRPEQRERAVSPCRPAVPDRATWWDGPEGGAGTVPLSHGLLAVSRTVKRDEGTVPTRPGPDSTDRSGFAPTFGSGRKSGLFHPWEQELERHLAPAAVREGRQL